MLLSVDNHYGAAITYSSTITYKSVASVAGGDTLWVSWTDSYYILEGSTDSVGIIEGLTDSC